QEVTEQEAVVLQKLHLNPQALGVFSFGFAHLNRDRLTMVSIEGVKPNLTSIMKGTYPLSRTLYLYVKVKSIQQNQDLLEYLREFLSEAASGPQGYLTSFGFVPLRPEERQGSLESVTQASRRTP
ncbi:MAG: PstS family phosphate ABC transporter substrate-binding protein, partial [Holosporales bacterium]